SRVPSWGPHHGKARRGAAKAARAEAESRRRRSGQFAPPVFQASVRAPDDGGIDPGDRVREHRQSAAGKGRRATSRNGCPAQPGSGTVPRRAAVAYRECDAGVARRSIRSLVCNLGRAMADASALQRAGELYAAHGIELERVGRDGGAVSALRPVIWTRSSDSVDASGRHARAKEWTRG